MLVLMSVGTTAQSDLLLSRSKVHSAVRGVGTGELRNQQGEEFIHGRKLDEDIFLLETNGGEEDNNRNVSEDEDEGHGGNPSGDHDKSKEDSNHKMKKKKAPKRRECKIGKFNICDTSTKTFPSLLFLDLPYLAHETT